MAVTVTAAATIGVMGQSASAQEVAPQPPPFLSVDPRSVGITRNLGPGDTGADVAAVQRLLYSYGYSVPLHGTMDAQTWAEVVRYQRDNHIQANGVVNARTARTMRIVWDPPTAVRSTRTTSTSSGRGGCAGIYDELVRQGASTGVAQTFAYRIAPRESGCRAAFVHDHDDWSYSRFGLNGKTAGLRANWRRMCGADVRSDTQALSVDVRCALAAYRAMGWRPWR